MAGRGPDERWGRFARLDRGEVEARLSGFPEERPERRNATGGAPEGAPARKGRRAPSTRCQTKTLRLTRRSPPSFEGDKKRRRRPSAELTPGADESRLHECRRDALIGEWSDAVLRPAMSAGCLTCESEMTPVRRELVAGPGDDP